MEFFLYNDEKDFRTGLRAEDIVLRLGGPGDPGFLMEVGKNLQRRDDCGMPSNKKHGLGGCSVSKWPGGGV